MALVGLIDWLEFTLLDASKPHDYVDDAWTAINWDGESDGWRDGVQWCKEILGLPIDGWQVLPRGKMGYKRQMVQGNVWILWAGAEGMGVHVICSGQGVRQLEQYKSVPDIIDKLNELGFTYQITRIDLAIDDYDGKLLDYGKIVRYARNGLYVSQWRTCKIIDVRDTGDNNVIGGSVYFGSGKSRCMCRIYRKGLEQQDATRPDWTRLEIELKEERAANLVKVANLREGIGQVVSMILAQYLTFKRRGKSQQKTRWQTAGWWARLIGEVKPLRLTTAPEQRTLQQVEDWLMRQVSANMAMLAMAAQEDDDAAFKRLCQRLATVGKSKMRQKHYSMVGQSINQPDKGQ